MDEYTRQDFVNTTELKEALFKAKWDWTVDRTLKQMRLTTTELQDELEHAEQHDAWMRPRIDFMYNFFDFDSDRTVIRQKFAAEMHKKTTLKDIGEALDEFIYDSKAYAGGNFDAAQHALEQPFSATQDRSQRHFDWTEQIANAFDPLKPEWIEDEQEVENVLKPRKRMEVKEMLNRIKEEDALTDHSIGSLTPEEHQEIALFHSFKQDPFYRHHLRTHLS